MVVANFEDGCGEINVLRRRCLSEETPTDAGGNDQT